MNHRLSWPGASGRSPDRSARGIGSADAPGVETASASRAIVLRSKITRTGSSTPKASRIRETTWVARSECPPSSKKSAVTPGGVRPSTSVQMPVRTSSSGVRGGTWTLPSDSVARAASAA